MHDPDVPGTRGLEQSHPGVALMRRLYAEALRADVLRGDWAFLFDAHAMPDIELHPAATYLDAAEVLRGREAWLGFWRTMGEPFDSFTWEVEDILGAGDDVVVLCTAVAVGRGSGVATRMAEAHRWTLRGDRVVRAQSYTDRATALRDAGLA